MATRILQPSPGADTHLDSGSPTTNMSGLTNLQNYANTSSAYRRVLLRFDLATLGLSGDEVVSGFVVLWNDGGDGGSLPASFDVHRVTSDWIASEATWDNRKAGTPWGTPGGDFAAPADLSYPIASPLTADGNQRRLDLTALVKAWLGETYSNYGLITIINPLPSATTWIRFRSAEHATAGQRPLLWIEDTSSPIHLAPVGNGYYDQWTKNGFTNAWQCLLEPPGYGDTFTTRIRATAANQRQSWIVRSGVPANAVISAIRIRVNGAAYSGAVPVEIKVGFRLAGTDYWHASNISFPNNTYADYSREFLTNPATGQAWQASQVNGIECITEQAPASVMGCISRSDVEVVFTLPTPPLAPTALSASANGANRIDLSWTDNASDETGFKIQRKLGAGGTWQQIDMVGANVIAFSDTTVVGNATYYYRVCAYNAEGDSAWSNEGSATAIQAAPTALSAAANGANRIDLSWTDNASDEIGFKIQRKLGAVGTWQQIDTVGANVNTYTDTTVVGNAIYYYRVCAYNADGDSAWSNEGSATAVQAAPAALSATPSGQTVNLAWTDNATDETGYKVERKPEGGAYAQIGTAAPNATSYTDEGVSPGTYYYRVRAYNEYGDSAYSNEASATIQTLADNLTDITTVIRRRRR